MAVFYTICGLLLLVGFVHGNLQTLLREMGTFLAGGVKLIAPQKPGFFSGIPIILGLVAVDLALSVIILQLLEKTLGKQKSLITDEYHKLGLAKLYLYTFVTVVIEELLTRGLCLGLLTKISFLSGTVAFYAIMFLSSAAFALAHLGNLKNKGWRNLPWILPQFISSLIFSFVFVKFGFLIVICVHILIDVLILGTMAAAEGRPQKPNATVPPETAPIEDKGFYVE
jgi:hypothetical protein